MAKISRPRRASSAASPSAWPSSIAPSPRSPAPMPALRSGPLSSLWPPITRLPCTDLGSRRSVRPKVPDVHPKPAGTRPAITPLRGKTMLMAHPTTCGVGAPALFRHRLLVIGQVDVLAGIGKRLLRLAIFRAQGQHRAYALHIDLRLARKTALGREQDVVGFRRELRRHIRQIGAEERDRRLLVVAIVKPGEPGDVAADETDQLGLMLARPAASRRADQALVMAEHVDGAAQQRETFRLRRHLEGREQQRARVLLLHQILEPRQHAAGLDQVVVAVLEAALLQHLLEHEGIARRARIDGQHLALEVGIGLDLRHRDEPQEAVVAAHEGEEVGLDLHLRLALPLLVGDDVVDRGHAEIELAFDEALQLELRAGRRRQMHLDAVLREITLRLRRPNRPVEAAGENDELEAFRRLGPGAWDHGGGEQNESETERADHRLFPLPMAGAIMPPGIEPSRMPRMASLLCNSVGVSYLARHVLLWCDDHLGVRVLELLVVVALDALELDLEHARLRPLAVLAELDVAGHGLEGVVTQVGGELVLIEALGALHRLA